MELKPLPVDLKYAYLEEQEQCPVVIPSLLSTAQESSLLHVLRENKQALGWNITDLKGISSTVCVTPRFSVRPNWGIETGFGVRNHISGTLYFFFFSELKLYMWVYKQFL